MKAIYKAIAAKLFADFNDNSLQGGHLGKPKLSVDLWNRQTERQQEQHPLFLPAVFVEFSTANYKRNSSGVQNGTQEIVIRVVQETYSDTFEGSGTQEKALEVLDLLEAVYVSLQDLSGEQFSKLERKTQSYDNNYNNIIVFEMVFMTSFVDDTKLSATEYIGITPDLMPEREM